MTIADEARDNAIHCEGKNHITLAGGVAVLWLDKDICLISETDIPLVSPFRWSVTQTKSGPKYAHAYIGGGRKNGKYVRMHRFILSPDPIEDVDHINGDGLDNRRLNIRVVTRAENLINTGAFKGSKSGIRGVCWYPNYGKWLAYLWVGGKKKNLGYFVDQSDAVSARRAAEELWFPGANRRIGT